MIRINSPVGSVAFIAGRKVLGTVPFGPYRIHAIKAGEVCLVPAGQTTVDYDGCFYWVHLTYLATYLAGYSAGLEGRLASCNPFSPEDELSFNDWDNGHCDATKGL